MLIKSIIFVLCVQHFMNVYGEVDKTSIVLVIDATFSMHDDIAQVKLAADSIFERAVKSTSKIQNFVLVTFDDQFSELPVELVDNWPSCCSKVLTSTNVSSTFKDALTSITLEGRNWDCPEFCMAGIKRGLEQALPGSYLYVFTDASAKDYQKFDEVKQLANKKQVQIDFVLTGRCEPIDGLEKFEVYKKLATERGGVVIDMYKDDIKHFLNYVASTIESSGTHVASKHCDTGNCTFNYTSDSKMKDEIFIATGSNPNIRLETPNGTEIPTKTLTKLEKVMIIQKTGSEPEHNITIRLNSDGKSDLKIIGDSSVQFKFGFSYEAPSTFADVVTTPLPDERNRISIQLTAGDLQLSTIAFFDMNDTQISDEISLGVINVTDKFYATDLIMVPKETFRIMIFGTDPVTMENIGRLSSPIDPKINWDTVPKKPPNVTVVNGPTLTAEYNQPLTLNCIVNAHPKPSITWIELETKTTLSPKVHMKEAPDTYMSSIRIDNVVNNSTYKCSASNELGSDSSVASVEIATMPYIEAVEVSNNVTIKLGKTGHVLCKIESYPKANITWYKNNRIITKNGDFDISSDGSELTVKNMKVTYEGKYSCEVKNGFVNMTFLTDVSSDAEAPVIDKRITRVLVNKSHDAILTCKILKGFPKPEIEWSFSNTEHSSEVEDNIISEWRNLQEVVLHNVDIEHEGVYKCKAKNDANEDSHETSLQVQYAPEVVIYNVNNKVPVDGHVNIACIANSYPSVHISWHKDGFPVIRNNNVHILRSSETSILIITHTQMKDTGNYTCTATNAIGSSSNSISLKVYFPVTITKSSPTNRSEFVGRHVTLPCQVKGDPKPEVKWTFKKIGSHEVIQKKSSSPTSELLLKFIEVSDEGYYTCEATNGLGNPQSLTYEVHVKAAPSIENKYIDKTFTTVEDDWDLMINCSAIGNPKPVIQWQKNGKSLDDENYAVVDGNLIIKVISQDDAGAYTCVARNEYGVAREYYEVEVLESPPPAHRHPTSMFIKKGKSTAIKCPLQYESDENLRWYRNGYRFDDGELYLWDVSSYDSGDYICRVSERYKTTTATVRIVVY